ncbi:nucleophile aminohydrolase [Naematelia encephala]|uniref:Glutathione hydrolase n=1 Tax=Naematelia encephala TaxID=71784 RepID=A0A1Y2AXB7_9TREE|nr:nucleophile aminohydrolase [Naematelia encephala]
MSSSPSRRAAQDEEAAPLLSSSSTTNVESQSSSSSSWQFWKSKSQRRRENGVHVSFAPEADYDEDGDRDEDNRPGLSKRRQWLRWEKAGLYTLLVVLGVTVGAVGGRRWDRPMNDELGDGPMVPPVYTLPPPTGLPRNPAYLVNGTLGAVASEDSTCSSLGVSILRDHNGTAVDAAITTTLCIGLLNGFSSGIGGGGFMTIRVPDTFSRDDPIWKEASLVGIEKLEAVAIDFRETSPDKSEKEMYGERKAGRVAAQVGGLAIGVPGELRGLEMAYRMYGTLPWEDLVMPVAKLARGWQVSRELARRIRIFGQFMLDNPVWAKIYAPRGALLVEGEYVQRLAYGKTLEKIAKEGASAFYEGDIAKNMIETITSLRGIMSLDDLKKYQARAYPAIHQTYHNRTIYTTSAPSSGGVLLGLLNILEPWTASQDPSECWSPAWTHRLIEAMKFAFGARSEVTDPAFVGEEHVKRLERFATKEWAEGVRELITASRFSIIRRQNSTHNASYYGLQQDTPEDHGTTHLSVADRWGGAASVTSTVNLIWGSHVMDEKTGVIFNDEQDDFAVPGAADAFGLMPSPWNYPAPGKKPLSSTSPIIILNSDQTLYAVLGGSGGSRIFGSIAQVILNLECGMDLSSAIEQYRVHDQIVPHITTIEVGPEGRDEVLESGLESRGHVMGEFDVNIGVAEVQGIILDDGVVWASSDSRKNGVPMAY